MRGHPDKICTCQITFYWRTKSHALLMCPELCCDDIASKREQEYNSHSRDKLENEKTLATLSNFPVVCLQTLRIELYSPSRKGVVRAVIHIAP